MLLRKGVYPYQYMASWERFDEASLPDKEDFYRNLNMENITDTDYRHANRVFKKFYLKNLGQYHNIMFNLMHYCFLIYVKILETCVLKYMN